MAQQIALTQADWNAIERELCERSLEEFVKAAWHVIEPREPLIWNWHLSVVCAYTQAFYEQKIKRLCLTVPPGAGKSIIFSVLGPAYAWARWPQYRMLNITNAENLAKRDSQRMREVITSDWFKRLWPNFALEPGQNEKMAYQNTAKGFRVGLGITSNLSGKRANCLAGETLVLCRDGYKQIKDIYPGDYVASVYNQRLEWNKTLARQESTSNDLYEITTTKGYRIRATGEHRFYSEERGWIEARLLRPGERLKRYAGWNMQPVRQAGAWNDLQGVLYRSQAILGNASLRSLQERVQAALFRLQKSIKSWCEESVLQSSMFQSVSSGERDKKQMYRMRQKEIEKRASLPSVRGQVEIKTNEGVAAQDLPDLLYRICNLIKPQSLLFSTVFRQSPFNTDERQRQFAPYASVQRYSDTASDKALHTRTRQKYLRGVFEQQKDSYAPYRPQPQQQPTGQSHNAVYAVPYNASSYESDAVSMVRKLRGEAVAVYDIEVERAHNFFAEGILTHNCLILDDIIDTKKAFSDVENDNANNTYDQAVSSRLNNMARDCIGIICQRTRENDIVGHVTSKKMQEWTVVSIAMEYEGQPGYDPVKDLGPEYAHLIDPRTEEGELMFPERYPRKVVDAWKEDLGSFGTASQLQQQPVPLGGAIIKRSYWTPWPKDKPIPLMKQIFSSWDTAYTEKDYKEAAYSAKTTWGIFEDDFSGRDALMVLGVWYGRVEYPELKKKMKSDYEEFNLDRVVIEKKASGISLYQDARRMRGISVRKFDPGRNDKIARAHMATPLMEAGLVYYPDRKWADDLIEKVSKFPNGAPPSADLTDTVSQAILYIRNRGWAQPADDDRREDLEEELSQEQIEDNPKPTGGVYG